MRARSPLFPRGTLAKKCSPAPRAPQLDRGNAYMYIIAHMNRLASRGEKVVGRQLLDSGFRRGFRIDALQGGCHLGLQELVGLALIGFQERGEGRLRIGAHAT